MVEEEVKLLSQQFVEHLNGTSVGEVLCITLPSHIYTFMAIFVGILFTDLSHTCSSDCVPNVCRSIRERKVFIFIKEFIIIVIPLILATTVLSDNIYFILIPVIAVIFSIFIFLKRNKSNFSSMNMYTDVNFILKLPIYDNKRSFVTCCRSITNMMTVISILAVDFNIFPSRFAKTEKYGFSLMDLGVGFFVLSNAAVIRMEKIASAGFKQTILGCSVLFFMGLLRYYSLQSINYHSNVKEYGVHWNFFLTLATIKLVSFIILKIGFKQPFLPGVILCVLHQLLLHFGLENYVFEDKARDNWIDANREGLVSILGFTSLYLIGVSMNRFVLKKSTTVGGDIKTIIKLIFISANLFIITVFFSGIFSVSRRIVSLTYITWIMSLAFLHIAVAMSVELFMICFISPSELKIVYNFLTPIIFESINYNGFTFFLVANLLTGLVNIVFNTQKMSTIQSIFILITYMMLNCIIIFSMYFRKIQLKFW